MKYTITSVVMLLFASLSVFSQTGINQLIGYQEPTTQIKAQAVDAEGNAYYAGDFKGKLILVGGLEVLGRGEQDVFLVKTNSRGEILWYRIYGDASTQGCNDLILYKGSLFLSIRQWGSAVIEGTAISEYNSGQPYSAVCKLDTAGGSFEWIRSTSLPGTKLAAGNNMLLLYGIAPSNSGPVRLHTTDVEPASSLHRLMFLYLQPDGQQRGGKTVSSSTAASTIQCITPHYAESGSLFFLLTSFSTATSIQLGAISVSFPAASTYSLLVKTDTSLVNPVYKVLNPNRESYTFNLYTDSAGYTLSSGGDSLYMVLAGNSMSAGLYGLDGMSYDIANQSVLLVMDTNLVSRRLTQLNQHSIGTTAQRVRIRQLQVHNNAYYMYGEFRGLNPVPVAGIPDDLQTVYPVMNGSAVTVNVNGASIPFVARSGTHLEQPDYRWLGETKPYEIQFTIPADLRVVKNRMYFFHKIDNTWNPWLIDSSLVIQKGRMKQNADGAESTQFVKYLSDGSRIVMGYAKGRTLFDHPDSVYVTDFLKRELYFMRLSTTGQVLWYKRLSHSFGALTIQQTAFLNGKLYASVNLNLPRNSSAYNFISFNNQAEFLTLTPPTNTILFTIDADGLFQRIPLTPPFHNTTVFDVLQNGELLVASTLNTTAIQLPPKTFGTQQGFYIARINTQGNVMDAVKFYATGTGSSITAPRLVQANRGSNGFQLLVSQTFSPAISSNTIYFSSGFPGPVTISLSSPSAVTVNTGFFAILNANFSSFVQHHVAGPANSFSMTRVSDTNRHYLILGRVAAGSPLRYDNQELYSGSESIVQLLLQTDAGGNYIRHQMISSGNTSPLSLGFVHLGISGNSLLASGTLFSTQTVDTIQIGHAGLADAITLQFDTLLQAKRVFRLATPFNENMFGADLVRDTVASIAYTAQQEPTLYNGRSSGLQSGINPADLDENAFLYSVLLNTGIATQVRDLVRVQAFSIYPNPLTGTAVQLQLQDAAAGVRQWRLFRASGELVEQGTLRWQPGAVCTLQLQKRPAAGVYVLVLTEGATGAIQAAKLVVQ